MTTKPKCETCVFQSLRNTSACKHCPYDDRPHSNPSIDRVNIFDMARGLEKKHQEETRIDPKPKNESDSKQNPILRVCPNCGEKALFYNWVNKTNECFHCKAAIKVGQEKVVWFQSTVQYQEVPVRQVNGPSDLSLLRVKMFLADLRSWRRQYQEGTYVCSDFAKEVCDMASQKGIRCGYVTINFRNYDVGHAIVAFQTDWGLKYFEPQSGNEEDAIVGRRYSGALKGIPDDTTIREVEIRWNDGTTLRLP